MKILSARVKNCTKTIELQISLNEAEKLLWAAKSYLSWVRDGHTLSQERIVLKNFERTVKEATQVIKKEEIRKDKLREKRMIKKGIETHIT